MAERTVIIPNISCNHCTSTIQNEVGDIEGVESVIASAETKQVTIRFDSPASWEKIAGLLDEIGFSPAS